MTGVPIRDVHDRLAREGGAPSAAAGTSLASPSPWFVNWATGNPGGDAGPVVNEYTAMNYLAVYSCVSLIAGTIAALPLETYRPRKSGKGKDRAADLPEYRILRDEFNAKTSAMVGREAGNGHLLTWGNSYAQVVKNKSGSKTLQLNPLGPDCVKVVPSPDGKKLLYEVYQRGTNELLARLPGEEVLHVPGLGFDGLVGYSPVRIARHSIRAGMAMDVEGEKFVTRGIRPPGAIKFPAGKKFATDQQAIDFRERFQRIHANRDSALNAVILEDGADWVALGMDPESAQFLESRKFTRGEVAGMYRVPPHLLGDVEKSTSWGTGIGEQTDGFVKFCLLIWLTRIEKEYTRKLFGDSGVFCEHDLKALLRADIVKRTQALQIQLQCGVISPNEWREEEDLNPYDGGDVYFYPLNFARVDEDGNDLTPPPPAGPPPAGPGEPPPEKPKPPGGSALADALRQGFAAAVARCLRKEAAEAKKAAARPDFFAWLGEFYDRHVAMVREHTDPFLSAWSAAYSDGTTLAGEPGYAEMHVERSRRELSAAVGPVPYARHPEAVAALVDRWHTERVAEAVRELTIPGESDAV
jgi:HK97 family phage portal protein